MLCLFAYLSRFYVLFSCSLELLNSLELSPCALCFDLVVASPVVCFLLCFFVLRLLIFILLRFDSFAFFFLFFFVEDSKIMKPYSRNEFDFYEALQQIPKDDFLHEITPNYYGRTYIQHPNEKDKDKMDTFPFIILEDLTINMRKPSICDLKMGTQGHGDDADLRKVLQQKALCSATTSSKLGFRICGMRVGIACVRRRVGSQGLF
jgi:Inositol polyphosphate kinase